MKHLVCFILSLSLLACSSKSGKEEKELATQAFINCDFYTAIENAEMAIQYAGEDINVSVPALLILGKSLDISGDSTAAIAAYEKIVLLAPGIKTVVEAQKIANNFVGKLSRSAPEKVKRCPALQNDLR
ncbi:hypothetical protein [Pelagibaculum spongiae]|uniref:Lipoprotein n=1 Tax=Pelagibaculum spongiae TaxID=2080658 RepID=A0A2V1H5H5_9GAMM|nr:hypothetical protein [Pelagibaculum spongiae]PVZ71672.1 hypothetical protein DC094_01190 [Pelagibaculum spongiae]